MNEMYNMSIVTHNFGVIGVLGVIFINILLLLRIKEIKKYRKFMSVFTPIGSVMIAIIVFTGVIMMAAKHLDFTIENIVMIIFATVFIYLEVKRAKELRYAKVDFSIYKKYAMKILSSEVVIILLIGIWMWIK